MSDPVQGDIFRIVYNTYAATNNRRNILVLASDEECANEYVKSLASCKEIAIPAMKMATDVHLAPEFFESYELVEFTPEELDDQFDDSE